MNIQYFSPHNLSFGEAGEEALGYSKHTDTHLVTRLVFLITQNEQNNKNTK